MLGIARVGGGLTGRTLFPLQINWKPAGRTARQVMDRLIDLRDTDSKPLRSASDLADLMDRLKETP